MTKYAFLLPRAEQIEPAMRIAQELGLNVVYNEVCNVDMIFKKADEARRRGADILVSRGRLAYILKEYTDIPVVEIRLTGVEIARLICKSKDVLSRIDHPKIGVVTYDNMIGNIEGFQDVFNVDLHTYFILGREGIEDVVNQAVADGMDIILGGDAVNTYCRRIGKRTLFFEGAEDSLHEALCNAYNMGVAAEIERRNTSHLQVLLDCSFNGIIELTCSGTIVHANDMACKILCKERSSLVGTAMKTLVSEPDQELWNDVFARRQEIYFPVFALAGVAVVANVAPITDWDAAEGMVFSFYEMKRMERQVSHTLRERYRLQKHLALGRFEDINQVGREMKTVVKLSRVFATTNQPILICGEVGSGKALFAQSIHNASPCATGPFVTYPCNDSLSCQRESLSNAAKDADSGTLYLEHLDHLNTSGQQVLYRLLREQVVRLQGESTPTSVKIRVIASLTTELVKRVEDGSFLPELYYLISALSLTLPPLRTQTKELECAISMYMDDCVAKYDRYILLTKSARQVLIEYPWPGNYLQLKVFLERMALTAPARTVSEEYVTQLLTQLYPLPLHKTTDDYAGITKPISAEVAHLVETLSKNGGNRAATALELGISKSTLWRRMKQYGICDRYEIL